MTPATAQKPTYEELLAENERLRLEMAQLKIELANLKRLIFGQKRERFVPERDQQQLSFLALAVDHLAAPVKTEQISYTRIKQTTRRKLPVRQPIPAHIPRKEIVIEPDEDVTGMKKIGEEITEELEFAPGTLYVNRYIRPKYARPKDQGIAIGLLPIRPIEKGIAGPGLLAHMMISKYVDHLPVYRQRQQFKRYGIELAESTLYDWIKASADVIMPLVERQRQRVLRVHYLMVDETPIYVLDREKPGTTHQGYYWVYYDPLGREAFFDYHKSRSRDGPNTQLKDFRGYLQSDGYSGYDEIAARAGVMSVGCMAHARRYFVEAADSDEERANWMLFRLQALYAIERYARTNQVSFEERYQLRQHDAAPVMAEMKAWLDVESLKVLPRSAMGKAIGYMLNQWPRLEKYLTDGQLEIDNNLVENAIRPVALGRKNYLFAGSHKGARRAAAIYTLVSNARLHDIEPFAYLRDVLYRIPGHPYRKLDELLPCNWKAR